MLSFILTMFNFELVVLLSKHLDVSLMGSFCLGIRGFSLGDVLNLSLSNGGVSCPWETFL